MAKNNVKEVFESLLHLVGKQSYHAKRRAMLHGFGISILSLALELTLLNGAGILTGFVALAVWHGFYAISRRTPENVSRMPLANMAVPRTPNDVLAMDEEDLNSSIEKLEPENLRSPKDVDLYGDFLMVASVLMGAMFVTFFIAMLGFKVGMALGLYVALYVFLHAVEFASGYGFVGAAEYEGFSESISYESTPENAASAQFRAALLARANDVISTQDRLKKGSELHCRMDKLEKQFEKHLDRVTPALRGHVKLAMPKSPD